MSKYAELSGWLRQRIRDGELCPGDKLYTESELCAMFGISRQTVRTALRTLEDEGLIERRRGSGSYVSRAPEGRGKPTMRIGVLSTYIDDYIFPGIIRGMERALQQGGYSMQLACTHNRVENERQVLRQFLDFPVDGLIAEPTKSGLPNPNLGLYARLREMGVPVLFFDAYYPDCPISYVALDDRAAGKVATGHLIRRGHSRIAGLFQSDDLQGHLRYAGYLEALEEAGLSPDAGRMLWFASEDIPQLFADGRRVLERLADATAVFCYNDAIAFRLTEFMAVQGIRVPEDISIVSVDNSAQAAFCEPPLTSVNHPKEMLGEQAARSMLDALKSGGEMESVIFPAVLEKRKSVKNLKKKEANRRE